MGSSESRSGELALALVATVHQRTGAARELLDRPEAVDRWCLEHDLPAPSSTSDAVRDQLVILREAIHLLATQSDWSTDDAGSAIDAINHAAAAVGPRRLQRDRYAANDGPEDALAKVLAAVAGDAIDVFTSMEPDRLKVCADRDCTTVFVDRSQARNRRWCSSAKCGNRNRVGAHRQRGANSQHRRNQA